MPLYPLGISLVDSYNRPTTRSFLVNAADFASAQAFVPGFVTAYQAVTELQLYETRLTDIAQYAGAPAGGSNIDEGMTLSVQLDTPGKKGSVKVPSPVAAVINPDATIDLTDALMVALEGLYTSGVTDLTASDGETVTGFIKGTLDK